MTKLAPSVRVHIGVSLRRWARLWYILRACDLSGRGRVVISHTELMRLVGRKQSTLYSQINIAKSAGAIRYAKRAGDTWVIYLGGLKAVCKRLRLLDWGACLEISSEELLESYRATITAAAAADLQEKSRYRAILGLSEPEKKGYTVPDAQDCLTAKNKITSPSQATPSTGGKEVGYILAVDDKRIWVSASFVSFGASQKGIGKQIGRHERTVRRHLRELHIPCKQVIQAKSRFQTSYAEAELMGEDRVEIDDRRPQDLTANPREIESRRLFKGMGKVWLRRCNLYALNFERRTMKATRRELWDDYGIKLEYGSKEFKAYKRQCFKNGRPSRDQIAKIYRRWKEREIGEAIDKHSLTTLGSAQQISVAYSATRKATLHSDLRDKSSDISFSNSGQAGTANRADQQGHF